MVCLCSMTYHTMMPLPSQGSYNMLLLVDYLSVFNVMVWPAASIIHFSFLCRPNLSTWTFYAYYVLAAAMLIVALRATDNVQRLIPFAALSSFRVAINVARAWVGHAR